MISLRRKLLGRSTVGLREGSAFERTSSFGAPDAVSGPAQPSMEAAEGPTGARWYAEGGGIRLDHQSQEQAEEEDRVRERFGNLQRRQATHGTCT